MEGIAFIFIGAAIFTHSWHLLGLYSDTRAFGVVMAGAALALLLSFFVFEPHMLGSLDDNSITRMGELTMLKTLILVWAVYAGIVAAQGVWELEERAVGFYAVPLAAVSLISLLFFLQVWINGAPDAIGIALLLVTALMTVIGALLFFCFTFPFNALRAVSGWAMIIMSVVIAAFGLAIATTAIAA